MAKEEIESGLLSPYTAREIHQLVDDPDHEDELLAMFQFKNTPAMRMTDGILKLIEDISRGKMSDLERTKRFFQLQISVANLRQIMMSTAPQSQQSQMTGQGGTGDQRDVSSPVGPSAGQGLTRNNLIEVPQDVREAVNAQR
jgi:hypothetical protein